ncbi:MAG: M1 family metallopeptidase, partial [Bdellovibrionota bacterium]
MATQRFQVVAPNQTKIVLDQEDLTIRTVRCAGRNVPFSVRPGKLEIPFPTESPAMTAGTEFELSIAYEAENPQLGIYFTGPDSEKPARRYQVWTQGQDEDSRYWYPTLDYPNQKLSSEVIATVPEKYFVVSNGALLSRRPAKLMMVAGASSASEKIIEAETFHYRLDSPHVNYLVSLVVAELAAIEDRATVAPGRSIPIQYFVEPGREDDARRAFGQTPKMMEVFSRLTGTPYAYEKYAQTAVQDFVMGGMENTTATTQTDLTLHDARASLDYSSDPLVSHELAHQWFGNLLTCRDWSHAWLNEGFATFLERVWIENDARPGKGGADEAAYYGYLQQLTYQEEDRDSYRRPLVCNQYIEPIDLFDRHLYEKGGAVLNLLRAQLGSDLFWKSIHTYLTRHREQSVETVDLIRAIEDTTGLNLRRFFDQWVFSGGYPELELKGNWDETTRQFEICLKQTQTNGDTPLTKNGVTTPLFELDLVLLFSSGLRKIRISEASQNFALSFTEKPNWCVVDPGSTLPKKLKLDLPTEMLLAALEDAHDALGRIQAAQALAEADYHREILPALIKAVKSDAFWGVRAEVAEVLAEMRSDGARDGLIAGLATTEHPRARRAIVESLSKYRGSQVREALRPIAQSDSSYFVEAEAARALARASDLTHNIPELVAQGEFLLENLRSKKSFRDCIGAETLRGIGDLLSSGGTESWPQGLEALFTAAKPGTPQNPHSNDLRRA